MSKRRKRHVEHEEHVDESWLIPYADILTLLLALFIVLFASSSINVSKYQAIMNSFKSEFTGSSVEDDSKGLAPIIQPEDATMSESEKEKAQEEEKEQAKETPTADPELDNLKAKLEKYIGDNHLNAAVTISESKRGVEISLKDVILFDPGQAVLKEKSFKTLKAIIGLLNTIPNPVSIEGHTDNVPISNSRFKSNWELSSARAASVLHYFASNDIKQSRLQFTAFGEQKPLYPNDTKEHRQSNRRVNIVILRSSES